MKGGFYRKSLILILLAASVPAGIIGLLMYNIGIGHIEREMNEFHRHQLKQASERTNEYLSLLEILSTHWAFNPELGDKKREYNPVADYEDTNDLERLLGLIKGMNPLVQGAYLYFDPQRVLLAEDYITRNVSDDALIRRRYEDMVNTHQTLAWLNGDSGVLKGSRRDLSLLQTIPGGSSTPFGLLVIVVSQPKLFQLMNDVTPEEKGTTLVIDSNGDILLTGRNGAAPTPFDNVLYQSIQTNIRANQTEGTYSLKYGNDTFFVSFGTYERVGKKWTYLSAIPLSQITRPVVVLSRLLLVIGGVGFTVAIILAWLASIRIHRPIGRLAGLFQLESKLPDPAETKDEIALIEREWRNLHRESQVLQIRLESSLPSLRDGFLLQLVQGHLNFLSEDELLERMEKLGWDASRKQYGFLIMQLIGFSNLLGRFSEGDEQLVTFAAANIAEEIAGKRHEQIGIVNFQDLSVGILLLLPDTLTHAEAKESITQLADELIQTVNAVLKVHLVISIGRPVDSLLSIADMAEGVKETLRLREFQTGNQIIDSEKVSPSSESVFYPFSLEKEIVQAFRVGEEEKAVLYVDRFIDELLHHSAKAIFFQQGMLKLLSSIHHVLLQTGFQLEGVREGALYERLFELEGPDEMRQWFKSSVLQPYMKELSETRNVHIKLRVEKVMSYIEEHYMEDISLDLCADLEFTSPKSLSADFKRFAGMNFIDYVTQYRVTKAKELLRETDMKINEIAESVGYQPSYFIRIFKKAEGLTPGQYRENAEGNAHDHHG